MNFIDTHAHIYSEEFNNDIENVINRALESGVSKIILPSIDKNYFEPMIELVKKYPNNLFPLIGIHPTSVKGNETENIKLVESQIKTNNFYGIGEIGIDLYWDKTHKEDQKKIFETQLCLAKENNLPVAIHQRASLTEIFNIIEDPRYKNIKGVFHCFSGNIDDAKRCIDLGFLIGIGGVVTYKNSLMAKVVESIDLEYIVLETDSPYLPPTPYRGKRNEPSYIPIIAQKIAEIKNCNIEDVAKITTKNTTELFNI